MKTWTEKLNSGGLHEVKPAPINLAGMKAGEIILVPTARQVDDFIRTLPNGKHMDVQVLRKAMAKRYGAQITPFWRVLNAKTPTISRLSFGTAFVTEQRLKEGLKDA
jgi:hypothetical protein